MSEPAVIPESKAVRCRRPRPMKPVNIEGVKVDEVAVRLGIPALRLPFVNKYQKIGETLQDAGVSTLSRGMYVANLETTDAAIRRLMRLIRGKGLSRAESLKVMQVVTTLLQHHATLAEKISDCTPKKVESTAPPQPSVSLPPPGSMVSSMGVIVNVGGSRQENESTVLRSVRVEQPTQGGGQTNPVPRLG